MTIFSKSLHRIGRWFLITAALCFLITGLAKVASVFLRESHTEIFKLADPLLGIPFAPLFLVVGGVEIIVGVFCLWRIPAKWPLMATALLSCNIAIYRWGLWFIDYKKPCTCLGTFTDALHIQPETADLAMKVMLGYLLLGSTLLSWAITRTSREPVTPPESSLSADQLRH